MYFDIFTMLCKKKGLSTYKACEAAGLNRSIVGKWKSGTIPTGNTLTKISDFFKVTPNYLLGYTPDAKMDLKKYKINELRKLLESSPDEERPAIESDIGALQDSLQELQIADESVGSLEQAKKNTRPTETGRAGSKYLQSIYEFVDTCGDSQLANLAQYVEFLKSQEKNTNS